MSFFKKSFKLVFVALIIVCIIYNASAYTIEQLKQDNINYFDFSLQLETTETIMQPNTTDSIYLAVDLSTKNQIDFAVNVKDFPEVRAYVNPYLKSYTDFYKNIDIKIFDATPGIYPINVIVTGILGENQITKSATIYVNVIEKQAYTFNTTKHNNSMPDLKLVNIDKRNLLIAKGEFDIVTLKLANTGSDADFIINIYPDDINGIDINRNKETYRVVNGQEELVFINFKLSDDYNRETTVFRIYATNVGTGINYDLGTINLMLKQAKFDITESITENKIIISIANIGTQDDFVTVNSSESDFAIYVPAGTMKQVELPLQSVVIKYNDNTIKEFVHDYNAGPVVGNVKANNGIIAGLFSLTDANISITMTVIVILVALCIGYWFFFGKNRVFAQSISAKTLDVKDN